MRLPVASPLCLLCGAFVLLSAHSLQAQEPDTASREAYKAFFAQNAVPIETIEDFAPLFEAVGERRFVLLGESTHGSHEYYRWRDLLSRHLIAKKGFNFVGVEGDWQSIYRLNEYVKHRTPEGETARSVMAGITRWPTWMWANEEFADFLEWLRAYNEGRPEPKQVGLFGLDMQDPADSMEAVLEWFKTHDAENYPDVASAYDTVLRLPDNFRSYASNLAQGHERVTTEMALPVDLLREHVEAQGVRQADKPLWAAKQNALAVKRAEAQHHAMILRTADSWNLRAGHMHEAFLRIAERYGPESRGIVWAHNTHVGDARATEMAAHGQVNIGQLLRESAGEDRVFILGFATYGGTVIAAPGWGGTMQTMQIVPAHPQSIESVLKESGLKQALILLESARREPLLRAFAHRAIGVVYRPPGEAYVRTLLPLRYDALVYIDQTRALTPLRRR